LRHRLIQKPGKDASGRVRRARPDKVCRILGVDEKGSLQRMSRRAIGSKRVSGFLLTFLPDRKFCRFCTGENDCSMNFATLL